MAAEGFSAQGTSAGWSARAGVRLAEALSTLPYCELLPVDRQAPRSDTVVVLVRVHDAGRWRALCEQMAVAVGRLPGVSASATARADRDASLCEELAVRIDGADLRASAWRARLELAVTLMAAIVNEERFGLYRERCRGDY